MSSLRVGVQAWLDWRPPSGARTRLRGLLTALAGLPESTGVEVHLLGSRDPDPVLHALCAEHAHFHWHAWFEQYGGTLGRALEESRRLPRTLADLELDLLDLGSLPLPRLEIPMCLTLHDLRDLGPYSRGLRRLAIHQTLIDAVDRATRILVPSTAVAQELQERHPKAADRTRVVPPAIDASPYRRARPIRELPRSYFLHLGRPEPRKNLPFLIQVYREARARAPQLPPLVLAGPSLEPSKRSRSLRRALGEDGEAILYMHEPDDAILPSLLAGARALLFPSRVAGFGMPALEALAARVPVLAPVDSVQAQVAGDAGMALPLESPETWTRAILSLADSPSLRSRLSSAAVRRCAGFDPCSAARAWLGAWHECDGRGSAHAFETGA